MVSSPDWSCPGPYQVFVAELVLARNGKNRVDADEASDGHIDATAGKFGRQ